MTCKKFRKAFQARAKAQRQHLVGLGIGSNNSSHHSVGAYTKC